MADLDLYTKLASIVDNNSAYFVIQYFFIADSGIVPFVALCEGFKAQNFSFSDLHVLDTGLSVERSFSTHSMYSVVLTGMLA